ncbi:vitamin K epoxide reductase family protein [Dysgonomonas sp. ZJ279]|uniref:vitamin K epoxide reductase family protein n=1 Tax=Dysgonomonas sp. ZJ279 TaxID=2709796 RepID=UPI0013EA8187|nr:vitamin K epoxide reductase family protein [Dysgonomonas sp. ZJ279]
MRNTEDKTIFSLFLYLLNVKHTNEYANKLYNEHPYKYTLYGLSKLLSDYNIKNAGVKLKDKENNIFEIEPPFIAHVGNGFVTVYKITNTNVSYVWNGKDITIPIQEFINMWTGVILVAEPDGNSIEPLYKENQIKRLSDIALKCILATAVTVLLVLAYFGSSLFDNPGVAILLALNLMGIYVGYLLILKQIHIRSTYGDKVCSLFKHNDCNNILESSAAKIGNIIGWSEIGLGYFIANILIILFLPQLIVYTSLVNVCALPYSFWSIWYQKYKAKQWCTLCLIVQLLLWSIFFISLISGFIQFPEWNIKDVLITGCIYIIPVVSIALLLPLISENNKIEQMSYEINSIKGTDEILTTLLKKQPFYEVSQSTSGILFGNPDSDILITILTNPHCNPCAKMHTRVEGLLQESGNKICVQYIFSSFTPDLVPSNKFLISTYYNKNEQEVKDIFNKWFTVGKHKKEAFFSTYKINSKEADIEVEFEKHEAWKRQTGLRATPTVLVNGYKLPDNYKIEDLRYFSKLDL